MSSLTVIGRYFNLSTDQRQKDQTPDPWLSLPHASKLTSRSSWDSIARWYESNHSSSPYDLAAYWGLPWAHLFHDGTKMLACKCQRNNRLGTFDVRIAAAWTSSVIGTLGACLVLGFMGCRCAGSEDVGSCLDARSRYFGLGVLGIDLHRRQALDGGLDGFLVHLGRRCLMWKVAACSSNNVGYSHYPKGYRNSCFSLQQMVCLKHLLRLVASVPAQRFAARQRQTTASQCCHHHGLFVIEKSQIHRSLHAIANLYIHLASAVRHFRRRDLLPAPRWHRHAGLLRL